MELINKSSFSEILTAAKDVKSYLLYFAIIPLIILVVGIFTLFTGLAVEQGLFLLASLFTALAVISAILLSVYAFQALGIKILHSRSDKPSISSTEAVTLALKTGHRLLLGWLLVALAVFAVWVVLFVLAAPAKIPYFGSVYAIISVPVVAIIAMVAYLAMIGVGVLLPVAIWHGHSTMSALKAVFNILKSNLLQVFFLILLVFAVCVPLIVGIITLVAGAGGLISAGVHSFGVNLFSHSYGYPVNYGVMVGGIIFIAIVQAGAVILTFSAMCEIYARGAAGIKLDAPLSSGLKETVSKTKDSLKKSINSELQDVKAASDSKDTAVSSELQQPEQKTEPAGSETKVAEQQEQKTE